MNPMTNKPVAGFAAEFVVNTWVDKADILENDVSRFLLVAADAVGD